MKLLIKSKRYLQIIFVHLAQKELHWNSVHVASQQYFMGSTNSPCFSDRGDSSNPTIQKETVGFQLLVNKTLLHRAVNSELVEKTNLSVISSDPVGN